MLTALTQPAFFLAEEEDGSWLIAADIFNSGTPLEQ